MVFDPPYLKTEQAAARASGQTLRYLPGLCLLSVTMVCWEVMLSKGQEWDWLGDPFLRIQTLLVLFLLCGGGLVWREMRIRNPLINFRTLEERNFRTCCIVIFCAYGGAVCEYNYAAGVAAIALRLRCDKVGAGAFALGNLRHRWCWSAWAGCSPAAWMRAI